MHSSRSPFLIVGLLLFFRGFGSYRRYRLIADIPRVKARAAAMGLVEIEGMTKSTGAMITSPISGIPCLCYRVEIEAEKIDKDQRISWARPVRDTRGVKFYIEDLSGEILVDATGADLELETIVRRSTSPRSKEKMSAGPVYERSAVACLRSGA